ncbi:MAG: radical SAM protein [Elusimicrobia bacterium]|nr:radical SAM protein [Elusimicrobiota bacterium]
MKAPPPEVRFWMELQLKPDRVRAPVRSAILEPGAVCNLRCPFCATGRGELELDRGLLTAERARQLLDALGPRLSRVVFYNWGEPLLNPALPELVAEAARRGAETEISTSLSVPAFDRAFAERLVRSGLTTLFASCDGATQAAYARYRAGGSLALVLRNLRLLLDVRARLRLKNPRVVWRFLLHRGNEADVPKARRLAARLGVPIEFQELWTPASASARWAPSAPAARAAAAAPALIGRLCLQAWDEPVVHADGSVFPCCLVSDRRWSLGNLREEPFQALWNKPLATAMRRYLRTGERPRVELPCFGCPNDPNRNASPAAQPSSHNERQRPARRTSAA